MAMTGDEFRDYLVRTFKRTDKDDEIYEAVTDVIDYIKEVHDFKDYQEITYTAGISTAGEYAFTLPSDFDHLLGDVKLQDSGNSRQLIKITKEEYNQLYPFPDDTDVVTGIPKHYAIYSGNIYLGPVPDLTTYQYEFDYATTTTTAITSGTTSVPFATYNRLMLKHLTLGQLYADLGDDAEAAKHQTMGNDLLETLINKERQNSEASTTVQFRDV